MPGNLLSAEIAFPTFTPGQSSEQKLEVVTNYLYMLLEQLRYTLNNLGTGNWNDAELSALEATITKPIYAKLDSAAGDISELYVTAGALSSKIQDAEENISAIDQYARSITLSVENGETQSTIKLLAGGIQIASQIVKMDGLVTFSGLEAGTTVINGGCIQTGTIDAQRLNLTGAITFTDLSTEVQGSIADAKDTADSAYSLARANKPPAYIKSTYIDFSQVASPKVIANDFIIESPQMDDPSPGQEGGSLSLYAQPGIGERMQMLKIGYYWDTAPYIVFGSPVGAYSVWDFGVTRFYGSVDFSNAEVSGLGGAGGGDADYAEEAGFALEAGMVINRDPNFQRGETLVASSNSDVVLSANNGNVRISAGNEMRIYVDGVTWYLDSSGWHT